MIVVGGWPGRNVVGLNGRFGVRPANFAAEGGGVKNPFLSDVGGGDSTTEFVAVVTSLPASGTVTFDDNGAFTHTGAADGSYTTTFNLYKWGEGGPIQDLGTRNVVTTFGAVYALSSVGGITSPSVPGYPLVIKNTATGVSAGGIPSSENLGAPTATRLAVTSLTGAGDISDRSIIGAPTLSRLSTISVSGVGSIQDKSAIGYPSLTRLSGGGVAYAGGIDSQGGAGSSLAVTRKSNVTIQINSIPSDGLTAYPIVTRRSGTVVNVNSIDGYQAPGSPTLSRKATVSLFANSVPFQSALGSPMLAAYVSSGLILKGIPSSDAIGAPSVSRKAVVGVTATSVESSYNFGSAAFSAMFDKGIRPVGIYAGQEVGVPSIFRHNLKSLNITSIESKGVVGSNNRLLAINSYPVIDAGVSEDSSSFGELVVTAYLNRYSVRPVGIDPDIAAIGRDLKVNATPTIATSSTVVQFVAKANEDFYKLFTARDVNGDWLRYTDYRGISGDQLMVEFSSYRGDAPFYIGKLEGIITDPRRMMISIDALSLSKARSGRVFISCTGIRKSTGLKTTLFVGYIDLR